MTTPTPSRRVNGVDLDTLTAADVPKGYTEIRTRFREKDRPEDLPRIRELATFSPRFGP
jgi:hypothetical protein